MQALLIGTLTLDGRCLRVSSAEGREDHLVVWPPGVVLRMGGDAIEVVDQAGRVVARVGEGVSMGGGEVRDSKAMAGLPGGVPAECAGPYWIVGDGLELDGGDAPSPSVVTGTTPPTSTPRTGVTFGPYPGPPWFDANGRIVPPSKLTAFQGPAHCGWSRTVLLQAGRPLGAEYDAGTVRQWVRDVDGSLRRWHDKPYLRRATLPDEASFTGYRNGVWELWSSPPSRDDYAYMVRNRVVEAWPRTDPLVACG